MQYNVSVPSRGVRYLNQGGAQTLALVEEVSVPSRGVRYLNSYSMSDETTDKDGEFPSPHGE